MAEQSWAFSAAPVLISLSKTLAADPEALNELSMDRTSASIKMRHGLGPSFQQRTINLMKTNKFSLNMDESTSSGSSQVVTILVNVFDCAVGRVALHHLTSFSLTRVTTANIFEAVVGFFDTHDIPWANCMSILMDSCAVMRGSKNGLEKKIREEVAPHLLDIDGDVCHHVHNATKKFCSGFRSWVEGLFMDLYNEYHWSASNQDVLKELCFILGVKFFVPHHFATHRWLSCLDSAESCLLQLAPLTLYIFGFLSASDRQTYQAISDAICKDVSKEGKQRIRELQLQLQGRATTDDGKKRKQRLVDKIFYNRKWTRMILGVYSAVLPILQEYVKLFQSATPLVHKLFDKQQELFKSFLGCFLKAEAYSSMNAMQLKDDKKLCMSSTSIQLSDKMMFTGKVAGSILRGCHATDTLAAKFRSILRQAYIECAQYLQQKLPLDNELLEAMSALDPATDFGHHVATHALLKLGELVKNVLAEEEEEKYDLEVRRLTAKPVPSDGGENPTPVDVWWSEVQKTGNFPLLSRMATALVTCFHGPSVESSFNVMGDVLDGRSTRMLVDTYSSIQCVKYALRSTHKSATDAFKRPDKLHTPVNRNMCRLLRGANKRNKERLDVEREELEAKRAKLSLKKQEEASKQQLKRNLQEAEKRARLAHRRAMKAKLEVLAGQRKEKKKV